MSVPPWKQAIIDRRKKQEEEQKRKQAEEEAYLASVPPWKRALIQKREKEKQLQRQQQEKEAEHTVTRTRSDSFIRRQQQLAQERENNQRRAQAVAAEAKAPSTVQSGWGRRATPPAPKATTPPSSPSSPTSGYSHVFGGPPTHQSTTVHSSVTALPSATDNPIAKKIASTPIPNTAPSQSRASMTEPKKVVSSVKKAYEDKAQGQEIPAWKKALLQRRKEKEVKGEATASASSPLLDRKTSPQEVEATDGGSFFKRDQKVEPHPVGAPHSSLPINRKSSPDETSKSTQRSGLALGRRASPLEKQDLEKPVKSTVEKVAVPTEPMQPALVFGRRGSPLEKRHEEKPPIEKVAAPMQPKQPALALARRGSPLEKQGQETPVGPVTGSTVASSQPKKAEPDPLALVRKSSPAESVRTDRGSAKLFSFERKHSAESFEGVKSISSTRRQEDRDNDKLKPSAPAVAEQGRPVSPQGRPTPKRAAPPPPPGSKKQPWSAPPKQQQETTTARKAPAQSKPPPEIVNRGESEVSSHAQSIQKEGVTQRAPVYKEVDEWASVPEEDPKFRSLPLWKQALIKRRRADYAKRMGLTTCVDDVPQSNGPVTKNDFIHNTPWNPRNNLTEDTSVNVPLWKQEMMKRKKGDGSQNVPNAMSSHEKSHLAKKPAPVKTDMKTTPGNVQELLNRFSNKTTPPSSPSAVTSRAPRTPSPTDRASSRPAHTATGVPPTTSSSSRTKTFTWSPGDGVMPDEALSDDSSDEDEATVTNIDDLSSEEDDDDSGISAKKGRSQSVPDVVLLHPPRALADDSGQTLASILVKPSNRTKKTLRRVSFSETELCKEHTYPLYDYNDYEMIQEEDTPTHTSFSMNGEGAEGSDNEVGLSQRLHPSLCSPEPDMDNYRYSPSQNRVSSPTSGLHSYKPSILSNYGDSLHQHIHDNYTSAMQNEDTVAEEQEEEVDASAPSEGSTLLSNFYASLSTDTAAMLW